MNTIIIIITTTTITTTKIDVACSDDKGSPEDQGWSGQKRWVLNPHWLTYSDFPPTGWVRSALKNHIENTTCFQCTHKHKKRTMITAHTHIHTHMHTHTHTHAYTPAHTRTHTHTQYTTIIVHRSTHLILHLLLYGRMGQNTQKYTTLAVDSAIIA